MNPIFQMIRLARGGQNPLSMLQGMMGNPQAQELQRMIQGKNYNQLLQMADNAARERGTTVERMAQQLGIPFHR